MGRSIITSTAVAVFYFGATMTALAHDCTKDLGSWSMVGLPAFGAGDAVSKLFADTSACHVLGVYDCDVTTADGITYHLSQDFSTKAIGVVQKSKPIVAGEQLPFGLLTTDTLKQAGVRIRAAVGEVGYGRSWRKPISVGFFCDIAPQESMLFEVRFDANGQMASVFETPIRNGSLYTSDVTYNFGGPEPE